MHARCPAQDQDLGKQEMGMGTGRGGQLHRPPARYTPPPTIWPASCCHPVACVHIRCVWWLPPSFATPRSTEGAPCRRVINTEQSLLRCVPSPTPTTPSTEAPPNACPNVLRTVCRRGLQAGLRSPPAREGPAAPTRTGCNSCRCRPAFATHTLNCCNSI
jgi:hypothetical protein